MLRIVLDTNVLVGDAYAEHSACAQIVEACVFGSHDLSLEGQGTGCGITHRPRMGFMFHAAARDRRLGDLVLPHVALRLRFCMPAPLAA
jgi:hypothetical protein